MSEVVATEQRKCSRHNSVRNVNYQCAQTKDMKYYFSDSEWKLKQISVADLPVFRGGLWKWVSDKEAKERQSGCVIWKLIYLLPKCNQAWIDIAFSEAYKCRECIFRYFSFWLGHGFVSDFCKGGLCNSVCLLYKKLAIWLLYNWQRFSDLTFLIVCVRVAFSPFNQQKQNIRGKVIIWFCLGTEARGNFLSRAFFRTCIPNLLKFLLFINWVKSGITPDKVPLGLVLGSSCDHYTTGRLTESFSLIFFEKIDYIL